MYRQCGPVVVRASAFTTDAGEDPWPDLVGEHAGAAGARRAWVTAAWSRPGVAEAVEAASPGLASQVDAVVAGTAGGRGERRVAVALARYLLRMRYRATPFGLFAGVGIGEAGPGLAVRWGPGHQAVARADAAWLADVITRLEACPGLLRRMRVTADPACAVRGGRLELCCRQIGPGGMDVAPQQVSVRYTAAVRAVMTAAATPVLAGDLAGLLGCKYPGVPASVIEAMLADLVRHRFLHTCLRAPMTVCDGLAYLNSQLAAVAADEIADSAPVVRALREVERLLAGVTRALPAERRGLRVAVRDRMVALSGVSAQPVTTDLLLDCRVVVPRAVVAEAERAAAVLTRLSPCPGGTAAWRDYHARFLDRFGPGVAVPVLEVTDPHAGLGFPAGYRGSVLRLPAEQLPAGRDQRILAIAQLAALDGSTEVVLSDQMLAELAIKAEVREPWHLDLCFQLHAADREAVRDGAFTVAVVSFSPAAGSTTGRFLGLMPAGLQARLVGGLTDIPAEDRVVRAQVSCPPLQVQVENVGRSPGVWPVVSLGEYSDGHGVPLADLAVIADALRLRLVSISTGRMIEAVLMNTVEAVHHVHPLARFLGEVSRSGEAVLGPFPWGQARRLPFLPRIRYGKAVLSPATWRIDASVLPCLGSRGRRGEEELAGCRARLRIPSVVYLGAGDRRLRLDLDDPGQGQLLIAELRRTGHVLLREAPGPEAFGWFGGRAHEIVVTLASRRLDGVPKRRPAAVPPMVAGREHGYLPGGSAWASARIYAQVSAWVGLLTEHLPDVLGSADAGCWWHVGHVEPRPHLRVRVRLPGPEAFGRIAQVVGRWACRMRSLGLISDLEWDTYYPEAGRFGTGLTLTAAEDVFAADTAAAITEMAGAGGDVLPRPGLVAASLVDLAVCFAGREAAGMRWLIKHGRGSQGRSVERAVRDDAVQLGNPDGDFAAVRQAAGGEAVLRAWRRRRRALETYAAALGPGPDRDLVLGSLLDLHMNRVCRAGPGESGDICWHLARSAALAWTARRGTVPG